MEWLGLSEGAAIGILLFLLMLTAPLPRGVLETVLTLRPGWMLLVAAASTSLVPFVENAKILYEYQPRNQLGGQAYETDPRWLASKLAIYRSIMVGIMLLCFSMCQSLCSRMVAAQAAEERMEKNLFATKKQAQAASDQSLKMLDEVEGLKKGNAGTASKEELKLEKILMENVKLKEKATAAEKELQVVKDQAKAFNREHDRLLEQIHQLEKKAGGKGGEQKKG